MLAVATEVSKTLVIDLMKIELALINPKVTKQLRATATVVLMLKSNFNKAFQGLGASSIGKCEYSILQVSFNKNKIVYNQPMFILSNTNHIDPKRPTIDDTGGDKFCLICTFIVMVCITSKHESEGIRDEKREDNSLKIWLGPRSMRTNDCSGNLSRTTPCWRLRQVQCS